MVGEPQPDLTPKTGPPELKVLHCDEADEMKSKRFTDEQIIGMLKEAEAGVEVALDIQDAEGPHRKKTVKPAVMISI